MNYTISSITEEDRQPIMDIFNYYIENSFAAYAEKKFPYEAFDIFLQMSDGYPTATVRDGKRKVLGFGFLRAHNPMSSFAQTAEITYFLSHEYIGKGMGKHLLHYLEEEGKKKGIKNILAHIYIRKDFWMSSPSCSNLKQKGIIESHFTLEIFAHSSISSGYIPKVIRSSFASVAKSAQLVDRFRPDSFEW